MSARCLVAIDLDGTLIGESLVVARADADAIHRAAEANIAVCLATGRQLIASRPYADALNLRGPMIVLQGGAAYDLATGRLLFMAPLAEATALRAYDWMKEHGFHVQLYYGDSLYLDLVDERAREYIRLTRVEPVMVADLRRLLSGKPPPLPGPVKVLGISSEAEVASAIRALGAELGDRASVFRSLRNYVEVTDPRANKGEALRRVAAALEIPMEATAAIGDSDNDVPMFETAARSFCVGDGTPAAKAAAGRVVASQAQCGVAEALSLLLEDAVAGGAAP